MGLVKCVLSGCKYERLKMNASPYSELLFSALIY